MTYDICTYNWSSQRKEETKNILRNDQNFSKVSENYKP